MLKNLTSSYLSIDISFLLVEEFGVDFQKAVKGVFIFAFYPFTAHRILFLIMVKN